METSAGVPRAGTPAAPEEQQAQKPGPYHGNRNFIIGSPGALTDTATPFCADADAGWGAAEQPTGLPQSTLEPASSPTTVLPPIVGIDTGENTRYVEPDLLALLLRHEAGASEVPDRLRIYVAWFDIQEEDGTVTDGNPDEFITSKGGSREDQDHVWTVPTGAVLPLLQLPSVFAAAQWAEG